MQISGNSYLTGPATGEGAKKKASPAPVFRLSAPGDDRIAGSVPVWGQPLTAQEKIAQTLGSGTVDPQSGSIETLAFAAPGEEAPSPVAEEAFGFLDLIDMINPLQHIPVIGTLYRAVTGDTIKPISQIVGGAAFGGVLGAAGGLVNAIAQEETGKDIGENVLGFVMGDKPLAASSDPSDTTIAVASLSYRQPHYNG